MLARSGLAREGAFTVTLGWTAVRAGRSDGDVPRGGIERSVRVMSISVRTVDKYITLKAIRTLRVGRRVLVPMASANEVARRGIEHGTLAVP
jgi:hypothetical protein